MAVKLGVFNVDRMLRNLTAKQFMEWEHYQMLEPFTEPVLSLRDDYRTASLCQMFFNMNVSVSDRKTINDFLLKWQQEEETEEKPIDLRARHIAALLAMAKSAGFSEAEVRG